MPQINKDVSAVDKMSIYMQTGKKMFRGLLKKLFLKKASGILFVGKGTSITHKGNIYCGKMLNLKITLKFMV